MLSDDVDLDRDLPWMTMNERAELLGAVFGDGSIVGVSRRGSRVEVSVSDELVSWLKRVPVLFGTVFGKDCFVSKRPRRNGGWQYVFYVTTHDPFAIFGVEAKYDHAHAMIPPTWVKHPRFFRHFLRGFVETDGSFKIRRENTVHEYDGARNIHFDFAQSDAGVAKWICAELLSRGYDASFIEASTGMHGVIVNRREHVRRLGEWLDSLKWRELLAGGYNPRPARINRRTGEAVKSRVATKPQSVSDEEWIRWRQWRTAGASFATIGLHVDRSPNVVMQAVGDIIPEYEVSAEELGLRPQPHFPKPSRVPPEEVEKWRVRALDGASARQIAKEFGRGSQEVQNAVADIRFDRRLAKHGQRSGGRND